MLHFRWVVGGYLYIMFSRPRIYSTAKYVTIQVMLFHIKFLRFVFHSNSRLYNWESYHNIIRSFSRRYTVVLLKYSKVARVRGFFRLKIQVVNITSKGNEDESWIYLQRSRKMLKWGLRRISFWKNHSFIKVGILDWTCIFSRGNLMKKIWQSDRNTKPHEDWTNFSNLPSGNAISKLNGKRSSSSHSNEVDCAIQVWPW